MTSFEFEQSTLTLTAKQVTTDQ